MKNSLAIIIGLVLLCTVGTTLYIAQRKQQDKLQTVLSDLKYEYERKEGGKDFALATLKEDMRLCYRNEGVTFSPDLQLYENGKTVQKLSSILQEKTLVIRVSQLHCQACLSVIIPMLEKLENKNVMYWMDYTNKRYMEEFKKNCNVQHRFFKISSLPLSIEELNVPFMFLLDKDMKTDCVFIPHKELPKQIKEYLEIVKDRI